MYYAKKFHGIRKTPRYWLLKRLKQTHMGGEQTIRNLVQRRKTLKPIRIPTYAEILPLHRNPSPQKSILHFIQLFRRSQAQSIHGCSQTKSNWKHSLQRNFCQAQTTNSKSSMWWHSLKKRIWYRISRYCIKTTDHRVENVL